jgi:hypothetical protein
MKMKLKKTKEYTPFYFFLTYFLEKRRVFRMPNILINIEICDAHVLGKQHKEVHYAKKMHDSRMSRQKTS